MDNPTEIVFNHLRSMASQAFELIHVNLLAIRQFKLNISWYYVKANHLFDR